MFGRWQSCEPQGRCRQRLTGYVLSVLGVLLGGMIVQQTISLWTAGAAPVSLEALLYEGAGAVLLTAFGFGFLAYSFSDCNEFEETLPLEPDDVKK